MQQVTRPGSGATTPSATWLSARQTSAFGYAGQYTDATTGLSDMRARWYAPGTGEFTSVDPALAETGQPYEYAGDDPVNGWDPSGLSHFWHSLGIAALGLVNPVIGIAATVHPCIGSVCLGYHPIQEAKALANFGVGALNAVSKVTGGTQVPVPFCGFGLGGAYNIGVVTAAVEAAVAGTSGAFDSAAPGGGGLLDTRCKWGHCPRRSCRRCEQDPLDYTRIHVSS